ncbi:MAG: hypothetical protein PHX51_04400 [Clostridia bacterium]|nr:hypothetical protein [Clostridia bacterium]
MSEKIVLTIVFIFALIVIAGLAVLISYGSADAEVVLVMATSRDTELGSVLGGGTYLRGDDVTLTAIPADNCYFVGWFLLGIDYSDPSKAASTNEEYQFSVQSGFISMVAVFKKYAYLTVIAGEGGVVDDVSGFYAPNTEVVLKAMPVIGYSFACWMLFENGYETESIPTGFLNDNEHIYKVMDTNVTIRAIFIQNNG